MALHICFCVDTNLLTHLHACCGSFSVTAGLLVCCSAGWGVNRVAALL